MLLVNGHGYTHFLELLFAPLCQSASSAAAFFVTDDSYPLNAAVTFELAAEITFRGIFVLVAVGVRRRSEVRETREHTRRAMNSVLYGSPTASGSSAGLSARG